MVVRSLVLIALAITFNDVFAATLQGKFYLLLVRIKNETAFGLQNVENVLSVEFRFEYYFLCDW